MRPKAVVGEPGSISAERAERPLVVALDVGSSSVRAALHDRLGRSVRETTVQVGYAWDVGADGSVRLSPATLLDLIAQVLDQVVRVAGPLTADVVAGGVSCFFHSIVGLDGTGQPMSPVLSWADTTSSAEAAQLRHRLDAATIHAASGAPLHASYWPARILRLRQEQPGIRRWAGLPELLAEALTGRMAVSRSMASGTGLLERAEGTWYRRILDRLAVEPGDLPALVADDQPLGQLSGAALRRWPRLAHVSWFPAWGDGSCGNVGLAATTPGTAALMVGTSGALRIYLADSSPPVPEGLFAYRLGAGTVMGGQLSEGGGLLAWASRLLGRSPRSLERAAAEIGADAHGLTVLPYAYGERGLGYHDEARGTLAGLHGGTDAAALYRAVLESIAFGFAEIDDRLSPLLGRPATVVASGGTLARSPLLAQIIADSLGRDLAVAGTFEASRHGAALLALRGSGLLDDLATIPGPRSRTARADPERGARYRVARARQHALYEAVLR